MISGVRIFALEPALRIGILSRQRKLQENQKNEQNFFHKLWCLYYLFEESVCKGNILLPVIKNYIMLTLAQMVSHTVG